MKTMPMASPELRQQWGIDNEPAEAFLRSRGFRLNSQWFWEHDEVTSWDNLTEKEKSAIWFLVEEWDYGGLWTESESP